MVETRAARRQRDALDSSCTPLHPPPTPVRLTSLLREHYVDEAHCALHLVLVRCSAATLLRLRLVWPNVDGVLRAALQARRRRLGLLPCVADEDPEAHPPLAAYVQAELDLLLRRLPSEAWKDRPSFVLFRLEADDAVPLQQRLVVDAHRRQSAWLDAAVGREGEELSLDQLECWDEKQPLGLRRHKTLWAFDVLCGSAAYYAFTQHLATHPVHGRACKAAEDPPGGCPAPAAFLLSLWRLRGWLECRGAGYESFRRDASLGDDLAVLLSRMREAPGGAWVYAAQDACPYAHLGTTALCESALESVLRAVPAPAWQRRPSEEARPLYPVERFDRRELCDPLTQRQTTVLRHTALGDKRGAFFAGTLCLFDALEYTARRLGILLPPSW
jgi:hypothetical protein